jgi:hypothetical protein
VDITLKDIVEGATDTLCAFKPGYLHATTVPDQKLERMGIIVAFSDHIQAEYAKALANIGDDGQVPIRSSIH